VNELAVLIAAAEALPSMKSRLAGEATEVLAFSDVEALRALELITTRRPSVILLERRFAATPRGTALVNRIKADPALADTQIRVVAPDVSVVAALAQPSAASATAAPAAAPAAKGSASAKPATPAPAPELDYRGTRRAPRHRLDGAREILVDGNKGTVVDLSVMGAQMVTNTVLKPNQRVRVTLADDDTTIRCVATVVWASFEMPRGGKPHYRAGLDFVDPDAEAIEGFIRRHRPRA